MPRRSHRARSRSRRASIHALTRIGLLLLAAGCSKYFFQSGPNPAGDGPITSCNPPTAFDGECPGLSSCLETSCSTQLKAALVPGVELDATDCDDLVRCVVDEEQDACTGTGWTALGTCERNHCSSCNQSIGPNPSGGSGGSSGGSAGSDSGGRSSGRAGADDNGGSGRSGTGGALAAGGTLGAGGSIGIAGSLGLAGTLGAAGTSAGRGGNGSVAKGGSGGAASAGRNGRSNGGASGRASGGRAG